MCMFAMLPWHGTIAAGAFPDEHLPGYKHFLTRNSSPAPPPPTQVASVTSPRWRSIRQVLSQADTRKAYLESRLNGQHNTTRHGNSIIPAY